MELAVIRNGAFSGSALSLLGALRQQPDVVVRDLDLAKHTRRPVLIAARAAAIAEARASGSVDWRRTESWSLGLEAVIHREVRTSSSAVVVQTLSGARLPIPYVVFTDRVAREADSPLVPEYRPRSSRRWLQREARLLASAVEVHGMGPSTCASLVSDYGLGSVRCRAAGSGPNARLTGRRRLGDGTRLLFVGIDWERKGGPELLEAFSTIRRAVPRVTLSVVGCRPDVPRNEGLHGVGRVSSESVNALMEAHDIFVMPTRSEAFGVVFVEALLKGMPVVGCDVGNVKWIAGGAGVVVPPLDSQALAGALRNVIANFPVWQSAAIKRGTYLRDAWSWDRIAASLLAPLRDV